MTGKHSRASANQTTVSTTLLALSTNQYPSTRHYLYRPASLSISSALHFPISLHLLFPQSSFRYLHFSRSSHRLSRATYLPPFFCNFLLSHIKYNQGSESGLRLLHTTVLLGILKEQAQLCTVRIIFLLKEMLLTNTSRTPPASDAFPTVQLLILGMLPPLHICSSTHTIDLPLTAPQQYVEWPSPSLWHHAFHTHGSWSWTLVWVRGPVHPSGLASSSPPLLSPSPSPALLGAASPIESVGNRFS